MRTLDDIKEYEDKAMNILENRWLKGYITFSKYQEIKDLLADQITDELKDYANSRAN
tara:strand:+ start:728 stop:898 length:171 start_codon:yes stop_codon:yes gene_type:complete